jgi:ribonuclease HI
MIKIYTDGACSGNPGIGGWGVLVLTTNQQKTELYGGEEKTTNNRMEMIAIIKGLEYVIDRNLVNEKIEFYTDSQYVKNGVDDWVSNWISNNWRKSDGEDVKNKDLWEKIVELRDKVKVSFIWVKGHSNNEYNDYADKLAKKFIKLTTK